MKKIIIIDDDATSVFLLKQTLLNDGFDVTTASDGMEGFVRIKEQQPNLIIMDIHMPNLDGYALIQDLKSDEGLSKIPIIVISADEQLEERFKKFRISHFFHKPYDTNVALKIIKRILTQNTAV